MSAPVRSFEDVWRDRRGRTDHRDAERMPFGKFAGKPLTALPHWYLTWALDQDWLWRAKPELANRLLDEYDRRHPEEAAEAERRLAIAEVPFNPAGGRVQPDEDQGEHR
jgi:hypothetical protein